MFKNVTVNITNDAVAETTEYFTVTVEAISEHVVIFPYASATIEILDDDSKSKKNYNKLPLIFPKQRLNSWFYIQ